MISKSFLPINFTPGPYDVICGRGKDAKNHQGNKKYKQIIQQFLQKYAQVDTKYEKSVIVSQVIDIIRTNSSKHSGGGGKFIKQHSDGRWYQVNDQMVREKIGQGFRDNLHGLYKSSTRSKRRRRENISAGVVHDIENLIQSNDTVSTCLGKLSADMNERGDGAPDLFVSRIFSQANCDMLEALKNDESLLLRFREAEQQQKRYNTH